MNAKPDWLAGRIEVLQAALGALGLSVSRTAAGELIDERVRSVAAVLGISAGAARRHLTDDALEALATEMAFSIADETPGADVIDAPRTAPVPLPVLARAVAGLAEAIQVRLREREDIDYLRTSVAQLAHAISAVGLVLADNPGEGSGHDQVVLMPPGLVNRAARYLEAAGGLVGDGVVPPDLHTAAAAQLATAFTRDAAQLRHCASS